MKKPQDVNTFRVGNIIDIVGVPAMRKVEIISINDSGVYIKGSEIGHTYISGRSPAVIHDSDAPVPVQPKVIIEPEVDIPAVITDKKKKVAAVAIVEDNSPNIRASRGSFTEKMSNITLPGEKFTIGELAEHNGIPVPYAHKWVNDNCREVGKADKKPGQRGRAAALYSKA